MHRPPSVTIILVTFNQERFVAEALRSVLQQRCSPIDVLVSDDCSQDGTFEIIQREVAGYQGPHRVRVNRNERNLGIARHFAQCVTSVDTDWIVCAAGDDVSHPERVARLFDAVAAFPDLQGFGSVFVEMDAAGQVKPEARGISSRIRSVIPAGVQRGFVRWSNRNVSRRDRLMSFFLQDKELVNGACAAWRRSLITDFPAIHPEAAEDYVLSFRAAFAGRVVISERPLVKWRTHEQNAWFVADAGMSAEQRTRSNARRCRMAHAGFQQNLADIEELVRRGDLDEELAYELASVIRMLDALTDHVLFHDRRTAGMLAAALIYRGMKLRWFASDGPIPLNRVGRWILYVLQQAVISLTRWDRRYRSGATHLP